VLVPLRTPSFPQQVHAAKVLTAAFVIAGFIILLVAVLGIVGGSVGRKNPTLGGILMLVAGGLNLFGGWPGFIIGALLIAGGILALVAANEAKKTAPPAPAFDSL